MKISKLKSKLKRKLKSYMPGIYERLWFTKEKLIKYLKPVGGRVVFKMHGVCPICGNRAIFLARKESLRGPYPASLRESCLCERCKATSRNRAVAVAALRVLEKQFRLSVSSLAELVDVVNSNGLDISFYEAGAHGPIYNVLKQMNKYTCSEFLPGIPPGNKKDGIRCENLERLTFSSGTFDFVISQDVFEHIRDVDKAWAEVNRVLKPGGWHIFTVPLHGKPTISRIAISALGQEHDRHIMPTHYHGDPLRSEGALVYTDFGTPDLPQILLEFGFQTRLDYIHEENFGIPIKLCVVMSQKMTEEQRIAISHYNKANRTVERCEEALSTQSHQEHSLLK